MRVFFLTILFNIIFVRYYAQESAIKNIIYDDLLILNHLYDGCIIQPTQVKLIVNGNDTLKQENTLISLKNSASTKVTIVQLDSSNGYYFIEASIDLNANAPFFGLFSKNTFKYILYKSGSRFYKLNGFLVSEFYLCSDEPKKLYKCVSSMDSKLTFDKSYEVKNRDVLKNHLTISVMEKMNEFGFKFDHRPYVKDLVCKAGM